MSTSDEAAAQRVATEQSPLTEIPVPPGAGVGIVEGLQAPSDDGPPSMPRRLWILYPLALIGIGTVWGSVLSILLGVQVAGFVPDKAAQAGALGIVTSISSVVAIFAQPLMGRVSDRTRIRFLGRRNLWILIGGLVSALGLVSTSLVANVPALAAAWAFTIIPLATVQAALTAVLPERVPTKRRGTMSALVGVSTVLGGVIGAILASAGGSTTVAYLLVAGFLLITCAAFAFGTKDMPGRVGQLTDDQKKAARKLPGLRAYPDFWFTFAGRFLLMLGYTSFSGFGLYMLRDYIKVGDGTTAAARAAIGTTVSIGALGILVFAVLGGVLVDKFGKVRIFVGIASLLFAPAGIILLVAPTFTSYLVASVIIGAAFGTFLSVDQVLITRVIPKGENAARDLGVLNVATSGPQVIAPALAGAIIAATGAYPVLIVLMVILVALAAISVRFIRSVP